MVSKGDRPFDILNYSFLTLALLVVLYPLYFILIASISNPDAVYNGTVWFLPRDVTFDGYMKILENSTIWVGYKNALIYGIAGTIVSLLVVLPAAYALSRKDLVGGNAIMLFFAITMFFQGGMIPLYLWIRNLGMINTRMAIILPTCLQIYNLIIARTFFRMTIPDELYEAAVVEGATNNYFFIKIVIPLSGALIAVIALFQAVFLWNQYMPALLYLRDKELYPLQLILRNILLTSQLLASDSAGEDIADVMAAQREADLIKFGVIIVSSAPLLVLYPFLQRYFVKGVMIGAIKG